MTDKSDTILITGARGLVGSAVLDLFKRRGFANVIGIGREDCNLLDAEQTRALFGFFQPRQVFHAAARVYGIQGNMSHQAGSFTDNLRINTNVIEAAALTGVRKITVMGTGCVYPYPPVRLPLKEEDIFHGRPHSSESGYAHAKLAMLAMLEAYGPTYDMDWAYIVSCNLFGPNDKFDTVNGHVIPSLIKKFSDAKHNGGIVEVWGDGSARRDFMYVKDTACVVHTVMDKVLGPINMGSGSVYSIREIVRMLSHISGVTEDRIKWLTDKPNGQDYHAYDLTRLDATGFERSYTLRKGLEETWDWYHGATAT